MGNRIKRKVRVGAIIRDLKVLRSGMQLLHSLAQDHTRIMDGVIQELGEDFVKRLETRLEAQAANETGNNEVNDADAKEEPSAEVGAEASQGADGEP